MSGTRIALFGGTFDPPHWGHVAALEATWATGDFDSIVVTVAGQPYQKDEDIVSPAPLRLAMAHAAFDGLSGVVVSDLELRREGPTYTIDTVEELSSTGSEIALVVGADVARSIDRWHRARELAERCWLYVVPREDVAVSFSQEWRVRVVAMEPVDLSSTWLRDRDLGQDSLKIYMPVPAITLWLGSRG